MMPLRLITEKPDTKPFQHGDAEVLLRSSRSNDWLQKQLSTPSSKSYHNRTAELAVLESLQWVEPINE